MTSITIGQVSGAINFAVLLSSVLLPLIIIAILVGFLQETNSAVTWSVVCRFVQGTWWPTLLRSDSTSWKSVDRKALYLTMLSTVSIIILGIAGVITPLGLDEGIVATTPKNLPFDYFEDSSLIGQGTMARDGYTYSRLCGAINYIQCPSQELPEGVIFKADRRGWARKDPDKANFTAQVSSKIPMNLTDVFRVPKDFSPHNSIAGPFDVQYRGFKYIIDRKSQYKKLTQIDNGTMYAVADYRAYGLNAMTSEYQVIEGGIVDRINGGYGFLNHTVPRNTFYRSEWDTDVLWMAPESACVANNVSIVYTFGYQDVRMPFTGGEPQMSEVSIRDYGGLRDLPLHYPYLDLNRSQYAPLIRERAWKAATITNFNMYGPLNLTRGDIPKTKETMSFNVTAFLTTKFSLKPDIPMIKPFSHFAASADGTLPLFEDLTGSVNKTHNQINPGSDNGIHSLDPVSIHTIHSNVYFLITPGIPLPGWSAAHQRKDPGTRWEHKIYTCATVLTASVKRVSFSYNATNNSISVLNVANLPKTEPTPLWGMENPGWNISDVQPIWGIVSDDAESNPALATIRKDKFYLPAGASSVHDSVGADTSGSLALPAAGINAMNMIFHIFDSKRISSSTPALEYGQYFGASNYESYKRWVNTTASPNTAWQMMHVLWADIMGNMVVGTNSIPKDDELPVVIWERRILYDIKFAVPAIVFLTIFVALTSALLCLIFTKKTSLENVRQLVNMTGTGRAITNVQSAGICAPNAITKEWVSSAGKEIIRVPYGAEHDGCNGFVVDEVSHVYRGLDENGGPEVEGREE